VTQADVKVSNKGMQQSTLTVSSSGLCAGGEQVATQHAYCWNSVAEHPGCIKLCENMQQGPCSQLAYDMLLLY
jgi:hypothetical protein